MVNKPGYEYSITNSSSISSFKSLNEATDYAILDTWFYEQLLNTDTRNIIRVLISEKYFPNSPNTVINYKNDYLSIVEQQIIHDTPYTYSRRIKNLLNKEAPEEEVFIRGGAFKRQIPRLYDYTCAITGMRLETSASISLIDACHIVPFAECFDDTITNGIALCPNMHRAFDRGLIAIDNEYKVLVSSKFIENSTSHSINQFFGKERY